MAIYYMDPHATVNGTGTWASPWSFGSATRTGLAAGDEIRVRGVPLTSLLTATTYTATVTSSYQLTVTAGGGLSADFAAGDIIYFPDFGTFCRVTTVTAGRLETTAQVPLPIINWTTATVTVRKVDRTTYPAPTTTTQYLVNSPTFTNLTVSDCWTDATTRVTDGSVKTLIYQGNATISTALTFQDCGTGQTGWSIDFPNTHVISQANATANWTCNLSLSTVNIGQIFSSGTGYNAAALNFETSISQQFATTITVNHFHGRLYGAGSSNNTINLNNCYQVYPDYVVNSCAGSNAVVNIGNIACQQLFNSLHYQPFSSIAPITFNYNGVIDCYANNSLSSAGIAVAWGLQTVNFTGAGFKLFANKRATQITSSQNLATYTTTYNAAPKAVYGTVNPPSGWTFTSGVLYNLATIGAVVTATSGRNLWQQAQFEIQIPTNSWTIGSIGTESHNVLLTFEDGSDPVELLNIAGKGYRTNTTINQVPRLTKDAGVYRTTGPSLKSTLTTRNATYWVASASTSAARGRAIKPIKVPCFAGVPVTVSGYIQNNITGFANGDVRLAIYLRGTQIVSQDMTTASNSAWEQFTLTFTPAITGEYTLIWEMFYAAAGSIWLDDLNIS